MLALQQHCVQCNPPTPLTCLAVGSLWSCLGQVHAEGNALELLLVLTQTARKLVLHVQSAPELVQEHSSILASSKAPSSSRQVLRT